MKNKLFKRKKKGEKGSQNDQQQQQQVVPATSQPAEREGGRGQVQLPSQHNLPQQPPTQILVQGNGKLYYKIYYNIFGFPEKGDKKSSTSLLNFIIKNKYTLIAAAFFVLVCVIAVGYLVLLYASNISVEQKLNRWEAFGKELLGGIGSLTEKIWNKVFGS